MAGLGVQLGNVQRTHQGEVGDLLTLPSSQPRPGRNLLPCPVHSLRVWCQGLKNSCWDEQAAQVAMGELTRGEEGCYDGVAPHTLMWSPPALPAHPTWQGSLRADHTGL